MFLAEPPTVVHEVYDLRIVEPLVPPERTAKVVTSITQSSHRHVGSSRGRVREGFEPSSPDPKSSMVDRYTTGLNKLFTLKA